MIKDLPGAAVFLLWLASTGEVDLHIKCLCNSRLSSLTPSWLYMESSHIMSVIRAQHESDSIFCICIREKPHCAHRWALHYWRLHFCTICSPSQRCDRALYLNSCLSYLFVRLSRRFNRCHDKFRFLSLRLSERQPNKQIHSFLLPQYLADIKGLFSV